MAPAALRTRLHLLGPRRAAFTLIELAVTITVAAVIAGLGAAVIAQAARAYAQNKTSTDNFADAAYALNRLASELSDLTAAANITNIGPDTITFSANGETLTYSKSGTDLRRNARTLAAAVSSFTLTCYDAAGAVTATPASVKRIGIQLTLDRNGTPATLRTEVFPRSLRSTYLSWQQE